MEKNLFTEEMEVKFVWKDINMEVIAIKAVGNYSRFVFDEFSKVSFYNTETSVFKNYDVFYRDLLNEGKCIFYKNYLVFKEGYEKNYVNYVQGYISNISEYESSILNSLKDKSTFGRVKSYIKMFKEGSMGKDVFISLLSGKFKTEEYVYELI